MVRLQKVLELKMNKIEKRFDNLKETITFELSDFAYKTKKFPVGIQIRWEKEDNPPIWRKWPYLVDCAIQLEELPNTETHIGESTFHSKEISKGKFLHYFGTTTPENYDELIKLRNQTGINFVMSKDIANQLRNFRRYIDQFIDDLDNRILEEEQVQRRILAIKNFKLEQ